MESATVQQQTAGATNGGGADLIEVDNPATGEIVGTITKMDREQVDAVIAKARAAQPAWAATSFRERARIFNRARHWLAENRERMSQTISAETGKVAEDAGLEISVCLEALKFWAKHSKGYLSDERIPARSPLIMGRKVVVRHEPLGVVGVIGPWNYPLVNAFCDCIPALMAGNSVVLKPSKETPMTALLTAEMMREAGLPEGVYGLVTGDRHTGGALIDAADFIMFTGSTATGRAVMQQAAESMTQVSLELGGKDPMVVLADADLERATNAAAYYSMLNGGQVCISVERAYVEEPIYDEFVEKVTEKVKALRQGAPGEPGTVEVGAVTVPSQLDLIDGHVKDAVAKGARVTTGGKQREGEGRFYEPTVLADVDHSMECMTEETFGPTLPIMKVRDVEEAVKLANDSPYGLQSSVWTKDKRRGAEVARRIEAGAASVNDAMINYAAFGAPMSGWKDSGVMGRHGANGIRKYCKTQTVTVNRFPLKRDVFMFPYTPKVSNRLNRLTEAMNKRRFGR